MALQNDWLQLLVFCCRVVDLFHFFAVNLDRIFSSCLGIIELPEQFAVFLHSFFIACDILHIFRWSVDEGMFAEWTFQEHRVEVVWLPTVDTQLLHFLFRSELGDNCIHQDAFHAVLCQKHCILTVCSNLVEHFFAGTRAMSTDEDVILLHLFFPSAEHFANFKNKVSSFCQHQTIEHF